MKTDCDVTLNYAALFDVALLSEAKQIASVQALIQTLTQHALLDIFQWKNSVISTLHHAIAECDALISAQTSHILHHPAFLKLEGSWRGVHHLVSHATHANDIKIRLLSLKKSELANDLKRATAFDQSHLFKKIYEKEFGTPGGTPYAAILGDYTFSHHAPDVAILSSLSKICAMSFAPFLSAASPEMMQLTDWSELSRPRQLSTMFDQTDYTAWRALRQTDAARFIVLTLPRILARLPYGPDSHPVEGMTFVEQSQTGIHLKNEAYCWMNAAYGLGERIMDAFMQHGWCTAIRGYEGGGKITQLPLYTYRAQDGNMTSSCPTEIEITDRREAELSQLGFLPLCYYKHTDFAVFFGANSIQKPPQYDTADATANAAISSRLPYLLATSRFSHYLKVMARDKIGAFLSPKEAEAWLNRWILNYVNGNAQSKQSLKAKYPLAAAKVHIEEDPNAPGCYHAILWLRPWLQMESLTASMRLVASIPQIKRQ